jgi:transmembrane sensor
MSTNQKLDQQAIEWMARNLSGNMPPEEQHRFEQWLEHDAHKQAYNDIKKAAASVDAYEESLLADSFARELEELAEEEARPPHRWLMLSGLAATILLAVTISFSVFFEDTPEPVQYATLVGEREQVPLKDGTTVMLNTSTQLDVLYADHTRDVSLASGEAFFNVAHDPKRVFSVTTDHGVVSVTGTSFNIRKMKEYTAVSVISGAVDVQVTDTEVLTLLAGEAVTFDGQTAAVKKAGFDATQVLSWRSGRVIFEDAPLEDVVQELNRYFQVPLTLSEDIPKDTPVTGEFDITDPLTVTRGISVALSLEAIRKPNEIVLSPVNEED